MPVANADLRAYRFLAVIVRDPVDSGGRKFAAQQFFRRPDRHAIPIRIKREHVQRTLVGDTDAPTLADRVAMNAFMTSNNTAVAVDNLASTRQTIARVLRFEIAIDKSCVVTVNKWDLVEKDSFTMEEFTRKIRADLNFMDYVPLLFISAKTGQRVDQVLPMALRVQEERLARLTTSKINEVIHRAQDAHPHPSHAGRQLKMFYGTQVRSDPPTFMIYVNDPKLMHFTYLRYLENQIRAEYGFLGTPIRIVLKSRRD